MGFADNELRPTPQADADMPELKCNEIETRELQIITKNLCFDNDLQENDILNTRTWQHYNELGGIIKKVDRLNDIMLKLQAVMPLPE